MKIAIFHNLLSGGAKRALQEMARRLSARHQLDVYTLSSANHAFADLRPYVQRHQVYGFQPWPLLGSPFGRLNQMVRLLDLLRLRPLAQRIAAAIEQGHYDIAFVHPCQFENTSSVLHHLRQTPSVAYCQEPLRRLYEPQPSRPYDRPASWRRRVLDRLDPLPALYYSLLRQTDRQNLRRAGRVLVNSEFIRTAVRAIYQVEAQVSYLGVDADFFRPVPVEKQPHLLSVGSLTPLKGFDFLVRALSEIPPVERPRLHIASNFENPPERAYLEQLAHSLGVQIHLLGGVSDEFLVRLYNQAALTAYAPIREPFGLVALESMACSTPVVAVREGGVPETVVHEQVGLLVDRDEAEFAAAVRRLLAEPGRQAEFGRQGRERILRHWTWDRAVGTLEQILETEASAGRATTAPLGLVGR